MVLKGFMLHSVRYGTTAFIGHNRQKYLTIIYKLFPCDCGPSFSEDNCDKQRPGPSGPCCVVCPISLMRLQKLCHIYLLVVFPTVLSICNTACFYSPAAINQALTEGRLFRPTTFRSCIMASMTDREESSRTERQPAMIRVQCP